MIRKIVNLKRDLPADWQRLRRHLKESAVLVVELDAAVTCAERNASGDNLRGRPVKWNDPEPWDNPVDGGMLLDKIAETISVHVSMTTRLADAVALWVVHTYIHDWLEISTFMIVTSATKRCGKSTLMEVTGELVWRPLPVSGSITTAVMFRVNELNRPTLMLDEMDTQLKNAPELRGVINGSQRRAQARVLRTVGEDYEPREFATFCPKAFASISDLPDTVCDRSLVIRLRRRGHSGDALLRWRTLTVARPRLGYNQVDKTKARPMDGRQR